MSIDSINAQTVSNISLNNVQQSCSEAQVQHLMNAISSAATRAVNAAGPSVIEHDQKGIRYSFTPYYSEQGAKLIYLETRSPSGVVSHMPLAFDRLDNYCARKSIPTPSLQYR